MDLVSHLHQAADFDTSFGRISFSDDVPAVRALRTGQPVSIGGRDRREHRWPAVGTLDSDVAVSCTFPLLIEGRPIGVLNLGWRHAPHPDDEQQRFTLALCGQCAQALDRARLHEADERTAQRQRYLAKASHDLSASLDFGATVEHVARLIVPELADACSVMVIDGEGIKPVAHAHIDPEREKLLRLMSQRTDATAISYLTRIARTGEPIINEVIPSNLVDATALDDEHRQQLRALDIRSAMAVPLRARGNTVGLLGLHMTNSGRRFGPDDVATILDLSDRAAMAIDNARTFQLRDQVAETLQRSLLPRRLPRIPGAQVAARYQSALPGVEVGGDFYDVFEGEDDWTLVLGDVCGKGPNAAALTAMVRYTLRAWAIQLRQPSDILTAVNGSILRQAEGEDQFCTVVYARLVATPAGMRVTVSSGGHPLPMVVRADGSVRKVGSPGSLLGLFPDVRVTDETTELGAGDALVLYTDGVTEARGDSGEFGEDRLIRLLSDLAGADAETMANAVQRAVNDFSGRTRRDDIAVLVMRVAPS
jgi:GAF domain-containing protein